MKFTDEELSRILGAHAGKKMCRYGNGVDERKVCVLEAAYGFDEDQGIIEPDHYYHAVANGVSARWFDRNYSAAWTVDEFLRELEKQGLA